MDIIIEAACDRITKEAVIIIAVLILLNISTVILSAVIIAYIILQKKKGALGLERGHSCVAAAQQVIYDEIADTKSEHNKDISTEENISYSLTRRSKGIITNQNVAYAMN